MYFNWSTLTRLLDVLTDKVFHHLRVVVRRWRDTQKLFSFGNGRIVDGLHVDVVATQHEVTHFCVLLCVWYLKIIKRHTWWLEWSHWGDALRTTLCVFNYNVSYLMSLGDKLNNKLPGRGWCGWGSAPLAAPSPSAFVWAAWRCAGVCVSVRGPLPL